VLLKKAVHVPRRSHQCWLYSSSISQRGPLIRQLLAEIQTRYFRHRRCCCVAFSLSNVSKASPFFGRSDLHPTAFDLDEKLSRRHFSRARRIAANRRNLNPFPSLGAKNFTPGS